jgi:histidinol-phosphate aminotransferase
MPFDLSKCARPNILALEPYRCAREYVHSGGIQRLWLIRLHSDYKDDGTNILLDANENAYGPGLALSNDGKLANGNGSDIQIDLLGLNRYPDP